ncbi:MAG: Na+/H+ antiporter subunit E [Acetobacteraceae bacterium]|nr:Na+/H+ antiporter subunit E [Acetobacteraceae bacterium]
MRRVLPYPLLAASLLVLWLLLNQSMAPGSVVLGGILAVGASWALVPLRPPKARFRRLGVALRLAVVVLGDIIRSNIAVARIILRPGRSDRRSGFVHIPLEMRDPYGLAALACIITATPGTIWVEFDSAKGTVMIHVLDLIEEEEWIRTIKDRYERRLMEIFE